MDAIEAGRRFAEEIGAEPYCNMRMPVKAAVRPLVTMSGVTTSGALPPIQPQPAPYQDVTLEDVRNGCTQTLRISLSRLEGVSPLKEGDEIFITISRVRR